MNSKKIFDDNTEAHTAQILIIGVGQFGGKLINGLQKYQDSIKDDFGCIFVTINDEHDLEILSKVRCERSDLVLIVAKEDQNPIKEIPKILKTLNGKDQLVIGFFDGFLQYNFGPKLTNRVNLPKNNEDIFQILGFFPDILNLRLMVGIDFKDIRTLLSRPKYFHAAIKEVKEEMDFSEVDLSHSESIIYCVYGDDNLNMETVDNASLQICNQADPETMIIFNSCPIEPSGTKPRVVILY